MVILLKRVFLEIIYEENAACVRPTKLEGWWQSSVERNSSNC